MKKIQFCQSGFAQDLQLKSIKLIFIFLLFFTLISCGTSQISIHSLHGDSCFVRYTNAQNLNEQITKYQEAIEGQGEQLPLYKTILGCIHYQSGNFPVSEQLLLQAYKESTETEEGQPKDTDTTALAASALGLIYLKEAQEGRLPHKKITEKIIAASQTHHLGKWMIVLYHIDSYRAQNNREQLSKAVEVMGSQMINAQSSEKEPSEDMMNFYNQLVKLLELESTCSKKEKKSIETGCGFNLSEKRGYILTTANGRLNKLLKIPPFNNE